MGLSAGAYALISAVVGVVGNAVVANNSKPNLSLPDPPAPTPPPEEDAASGRAVRRSKAADVSDNRGFDIFEVPTNNILPS